MFDFGKNDLSKILNPLEINKHSMIEFSLNELKEQGFFTFTKIIQMDVGKRSYTRYLLYSKSEEQEYVFEVYSSPSEQLETYLYEMVDTVPFSEDFLEVVGQKFMTTPDETEYERCVMPECDYRIDGSQGTIKVLDLETGKIEKTDGVEVWDYQRDAEGITEYLNVEMLKENGMFRIFIGQMLEPAFYNVYKGLDSEK
jgi:hypothetical protein